MPKCLPNPITVSTDEVNVDAAGVLGGHVTVCLCTRDRGASISVALRSLHTQSYADFDVVIVDQSVGLETERAVFADPAAAALAITYVRMQPAGLSAARNVAICRARGPLVAFTDDDCAADPEWLATVVRSFGSDARIGAVFGEVRAAEDDGDGYTPTTHMAYPLLVNSPWLKWRERGIGANMSFRLTALMVAGPFDEVLGPGAPLRNCDDRDMTYRLLHARYAVLNVPTAVVTHYGRRNKRASPRHVRDAWFSIGATYAKHLRLGDPAVIPVLCYEWLHCLRWDNLIRLRRPNGLLAMLWYSLGVIESFRHPIDPHTRRYVR